MARTLYCWRCKRNAPMLDEQEWAEIASLLSAMVSRIQEFRRVEGASVAQALDQRFGADALSRYQELTGEEESDPEALLHHRASLFGPPCEACGKPLRTPRAELVRYMVGNELSERRALVIVGMSASVYHYKGRPDRNVVLRDRIVGLAQRHERCVQLRLIEPGKLNQNAYIESFNGRTA